MNKTVDLQDAEAALELVQFAYFKKVGGRCPLALQGPEIVIVKAGFGGLLVRSFPGDSLG